MSTWRSDANPFPGLRPFHSEESHLFFGRDLQIAELLTRLGNSRFVAVLGASGSGKSSLARAGLLPAIHGGGVPGAGASWRITWFRPGADPVGNLARALADSGIYTAATGESGHPTEPPSRPFDEPEWSPALQETAIDITLRRSGLGLVDAVRQAQLPASENLFIVIDQFEELFRFNSASDSVSDDAAAFVKLFLEAIHQSEVPIYVALTMRSDFLGDCAEFHDLSEAINESLYLVPRMRRDQLRQAICGPIAVSSGEIEPRLVERLLNDVNNDPDQLPVLQHALMRSWDCLKLLGRESSAIDLEHYEKIGGLTGALSKHADEAYGELNDDQQRLAARMFRSLTEKGPDNRELRRPVSVDLLCAESGADRESVAAVIKRFQTNGRSFLIVSKDGVVDISHESLIRQWSRLRDWVNEEAKSREIFLRIADAAERHQRDEAGLLRAPELQLALDWWETETPNEKWGSRYGADFQRAEAFLKNSREVRDTNRRWAAPVKDAERYWGPLAARYLQHRPRRMLAIDGGVFPDGVLALATLQRMESIVREQAGQPNLVLGDYFDYVAGTGTGGLIAIFLARGFSVSEIAEFYRQQARNLKRASILLVFKHRYDPRPLAAALKSFLGAETDLSPTNLRCLLMVVLGNATSNAPWPLSSNPLAKYNDPARADNNLGMRLWELAMASIATPTAFPPVSVTLDTGRADITVVLEDGSLSPYANPAFLLYRMATQAPYNLGWLPGERELLLMSVGTGIRADAARKGDPAERNLASQISRLASRVAARAEQDILCRTVGRCVHGHALDVEQGDLIPRYQTTGERIPMTQDLGRDFLYSRYEIDLSLNGLQAIGVGGIDFEASGKDPSERVAEFSRIGAAAAKAVAREHFGSFLTDSN